MQAKRAAFSSLPLSEQLLEKGENDRFIISQTLVQCLRNGTHVINFVLVLY